MIYNFSDHHQRFQYQNQSSLVSPCNEHYVQSHRYSPDPLRGIIMNIPSVLLFHLVSFADVIVTASTFPIFFCTPLAVSYWNKLDILCIPLCDWLSKHPSPWRPSFDASVIDDVFQDLLLTPAASKSRFHYLIEHATHIRQPKDNIKALCQDY